MTTLNRSQQDYLFDPKCARKVTVIGVGSVGSQLVCQLAKVGATDITVQDDDGVESHNIPMSAYREDDLGLYKVVALADLVRQQSGIEIGAVQSMYTGGPLRGSVVSCVDDMESRMAIWNEAKTNYPCVDVFVDTRIGADLISVFAVNPGLPEDISYYEHFLYGSDEAVRPTCGEHGIVYVSAEAAVRACRCLTEFWTRGKTVRHFMSVGGMQMLPER